MNGTPSKIGNRILTLKVGDCFGEMAYVAKRPRTVSIRAMTDAAVLRISNEQLEKTSVYCQLKFTKVFLNTLITRLASGGKHIASPDTSPDGLP